MPLTASEHQKIAALQQVANTVSQMQSVQGSVGVTSRVVQNAMAVIAPFESSDPEFQELGMWLRQANAAGPNGPPPHVISNIAGQVQRMIGMVRGGLPTRVTADGDPVMWDPVYGVVSSPMFDKNEPVRTYSVHPNDWRGSVKRPFGRAFPLWNSLENWSGLGTVRPDTPPCKQSKSWCWSADPIRQAELKPVCGPDGYYQCIDTKKVNAGPILVLGSDDSKRRLRKIALATTISIISIIAYLLIK